MSAMDWRKHDIGTPGYFAYLFAWGGWMSPEDGDPLRLGIDLDFQPDPEDHALNETDATVLRETFGGEISMEIVGRSERGLPDQYIFSWTLNDLDKQVAFLETIETNLYELAVDRKATPEPSWRLADRVQLALPLLRRIQSLQQKVTP